MKYVRILLTVVWGIVYWPVNRLYESTQKWYFKIKKEDEILYYLCTPFYWIFSAITFIISAPYEMFIAKDLH